MSGTIHKEYQPVARAALRAGWRVEVTGSTHLRWTGPQGQTVTSAMTPRGRGARDILARKLRKAGLDLPR